jgi:hypothetical protein
MAASGRMEPLAEATAVHRLVTTLGLNRSRGRGSFDWGWGIADV